jgi:RND family efflux transporter MFP subunit
MANSILEESKKAKRKGFLGFLLNKKVLIIIILVLALGGGAYAYYNQKTQSTTKVVALKPWSVKKEDLKIAIQETGSVVSKDQVSLSFPVSGNLEVSNVYVNQGDTVKKGDKIASVKTESLNLSLQSAYNNYQSALDNLNSKEAPPTDSTINSAKAAITQAQLSLNQSQISLQQTTASANQSVASAQSALNSAQNNLQLNSSVTNSAIVNNAYTSLINTIKPISVTLQRALLDADSVLGVDNTNNNNAFKSVLGIMNPTTFYSAQASYSQAKAAKLTLDATISNLDSSSDSATVDNAATQAQQALTAMQTTLSNVTAMLNATVVSNNLSQSQLSGFQSTNNSDLSSVSSAISGLDNAIQSVASAKTSLSNLQISYNQAQANLDAAQTQAKQNISAANSSLQAKQQSLAQAQTAYTDLMAPPRDVDIASAKTQLTSASISVSQAQYNLSQATLVSPIDGVVSALNYKVGDIILQSSGSSSTDTTVATIINTNTLYIEANVQEADISKLKVGNKVDVTFDAIQGLDLQGSISYISLTSATNSNGIVTYLVRVQIDNPATSPVREGMTASLNFITAEAPNVLTVPVSAVHNVNNQPSVEMANGQFVPVVTGFTDGQDVEVSSGLKLGDSILY